MEIGIQRLPIEEYHRDLDAVSHSGLTLLETAPRCYEWQYLRGNWPEDTPAKEKGRQFHEALLEPHIFKEKYFTDQEAYHICPDRRLKAYKEAFKITEALNPGRMLIKSADWEDIHGMLNAVRSALVSGALQLGLPEQTLCWIDPVSGVKCKARPDFMRDDGVIIDVKTTDDASVEGFPFSNEKYKYYRQAAMQLEGATITTGRPYKRHVLICVEKKAPWLYNVFEMPETLLWAGEHELKSLRSRFAECKSKNVWPGYPTEGQVNVLTATERFVRAHAEELEET